MPIDILIFALIAAFLVHRLNSVLGTRNGDERQRPNPFTPQENKDNTPTTPAAVTQLYPAPSDADLDLIIDETANADGRVETGLIEIAAADATFEINSFMQGAQGAFEMVTTAYAEGDLETLEPLLSQKLFKDFTAGIEKRNDAGHKSEIIIHRIKSARIIEAHLGGTMAYATIDFDVEETNVTRDGDGNVVDGDPDQIFSVEDIWTFTRDIREDDPNWTLIETRSVEDK